MISASNNPKASTLDYLIALALISVATIASFLLQSIVDEDIILLLYVLTAVIIAVLCRRRTAVLASIISVAAFDFFFVPPQFDFAPTDVKAIPVLICMLIVSIIVSELAYLIKKQARAAGAREKAAQTLLSLSRDYANSNTIEGLIASAELHLSEVFDCNCVVMIPPDIEEHYIAAVSGDLMSMNTPAKLGLTEKKSVMEEKGGANDKSVSADTSRASDRKRSGSESGKLRSLTGKFAPIEAGVPLAQQLETAQQRIVTRSEMLITGGFTPIPVAADDSDSVEEQKISGSLGRSAASSRAVAPQVVLLGDEEMAAAQRAFDEEETVVIDRSVVDGIRKKVIFAPLGAIKGTVGVLGLFGKDEHEPDTNRYDQTFLNTVTSQTALAIERAFLTRATREAYLKIERERMRSALLSSVSHDLRTPLASIMGAASSIREDSAHMDAETRYELAQSIFQESKRLNRLVGNLLDMTKLESGTIAVKKDWNSMEELIGGALTRLEKELGDRRLKVDVPADLPLLELDDVLIEQVLYNLIENAIKYSADEAEIRIAARVDRASSKIVVEVSNDGAPLPDDERAHVFEKFYRGNASGIAPGAGLGLAICRGIVEAHGGKIWVEPSTEREVKFCFALKVSQAAPVSVETAAD